eukprot:6185029-Pleurochrysis_carterae.AAC.2
MPPPSSAPEVQCAPAAAGRPVRAARQQVCYVDRLYKKEDEEKVKLAARAVLAGKYHGARPAARAFGVSNHTNVQHWVTLWRKTSVAEAIIDVEKANSDDAATPDDATDLPEGAAGVSAVVGGEAASADGIDAEPTVLPKLALPANISRKKRHTVRKWLAREAVRKIKEEGMTLRGAAACINRLYGHSAGVPRLTYGTVANYMNPSYDPVSAGKASFLPDDFYEDILAWIAAMRALKFPLFADQ